MASVVSRARLFAARRLVYRLIIEGRSNFAIQNDLKRKRLPVFREHSLSKFRAREFVRRAIAARDTEAIQQGVAQHGERVRALNRQVDRLLRMADDVTVQKPDQVRQAISLARELRFTLAQVDAHLHRADARRMALAAIELRQKSHPGDAGSGMGVLLMPDNERVPDIPLGADLD